MASQPPRNRSRWSLDFTKGGRGAGAELPNPPGFSNSIPFLQNEAQRQPDANLRLKRSWDIALGPIKQVMLFFYLTYLRTDFIAIFNFYDQNR